MALTTIDSQSGAVQGRVASAITGRRIDNDELNRI